MRNLYSLLLAALLVTLLALPLHAAPPTSAPAPLTIPKYPENPTFEAGKELEIEDSQTANGDMVLKDSDPLSHFVVYLPSDYDPTRPFPVILCYHGQKQQPQVYPFKDLTDGKGYIIVGMEYLRPACYRVDPFYDGQYIKRLLTYLKAHLNIDTHMVFMGGFSQGGFKVSGLTSDKLADSLAGLIICSAGRGGGPNLPGIRGKPVLVSAGEKEENRKAAEGAAAYYKKQGAEVTLVIFPGGDHAVDTNNDVMKKWFQDNGPARLAHMNLIIAEKARTAGALGQAFILFTAIAKNPAAGEWQAKAQTAAADLETTATKKLADAEAFITARNYPEARRAFAVMTTPWATTAFADSARKRLEALDKDPAIVADIKQLALDARADASEASALAAEKSKDVAKAIKLYEIYLTSFPTSHRISEIKAHLDELKAATSK